MDIPADRDHTWEALLRVVCRNPADPTTVPTGFALDSADPPVRLALRGRHWFSRYALVFDLDEAQPGHTRLRAHTWAEFPGVHGRIYRALVIGTQGHRVVVRRILRRVAAAA